MTKLNPLETELLRALVNLLTNAPSEATMDGWHPKKTGTRDVLLYVQDIRDARAIIAKAEGK